jgi:hypothetical protein
MKVPAAAKTFLNTFFKAQGNRLPPGADILLDAEWTTPRRAVEYDLVELTGMFPERSVHTVTLQGRTTDGGGLIRVIIQADGIQLPAEVLALIGGPDGDKAA